MATTIRPWTRTATAPSQERNGSCGPRFGRTSSCVAENADAACLQKKMEILKRANDDRQELIKDNGRLRQVRRLNPVPCPSSVKKTHRSQAIHHAGSVEFSWREKDDKLTLQSQTLAGKRLENENLKHEITVVCACDWSCRFRLFSLLQHVDRSLRKSKL